jgi:hypothetical protein
MELSYDARMPSLQKFDTNKAIFVSRLLKAWDKLPNLTFGELLAESLGFEGQAMRGLTNDTTRSSRRWSGSR